MRHTPEQKAIRDQLENEFNQLAYDRGKYTPEQYAGMRKAVEREYSNLNLNNWKGL